jgi:superfamily II DNA/RNA helicase
LLLLICHLNSLFQAILDMKSGESRVLIASDVVARGIDIELVTYIINYDVPKSSEMYIHRIGRTGRAGNTGESFTLVTHRDWYKAQDLVNILEGVGQEVPNGLREMAERFKNRRDQGGEHRRGGGGGRGGGYRQEGGDYGRQGFSNNSGGSGGYGGNRDYGSNGGSDSYGASRGHRPRSFGDYQGSGMREHDGSWSNSRGQGGGYRGRGRSYDN